MTRSLYFNSNNFTLLYSSSGINVDILSRVTGISPSTIRKTLRERKIDLKNLINLSLAISVIFFFIKKTTIREKRLEIKYNLEDVIDKAKRTYDLISIKSFLHDILFSFKNLVNPDYIFSDTDFEIIKIDAERVRRKLSPNTVNKSIKLNLVSFKKRLILSNIIKEADCLRIGSIEVFNTQENKVLFKDFVEILEKYFLSKLKAENLINKSLKLKLSNLEIIEKSFIEDQKLDYQNILEKVITDINIYFNEIVVLRRFDVKNKNFLEYNYQSSYDVKDENIIIRPCRYLIISVMKDKKDYIEEYINMDPDNCFEDVQKKRFKILIDEKKFVLPNIDYKTIEDDKCFALYLLGYYNFVNSKLAEIDINGSFVNREEIFSNNYLLPIRMYSNT